MEIYNVRRIDKRNFNPMVHNLMDKGFLKNNVQILTDVVGGKAWITISKREYLKLKKG